MITFHPSQTVATKQLHLRDVSEDQFFITLDGRLCQKTNTDSYNSLTDELGKPHACHYTHEEDDVTSLMPIARVLDEVDSITFQ
jgi:hypothetical protein